jgi:phage tail protein X
MIIGFELIQIEGDFVSADMLVWHRYRQPARGIVEKMLDSNPQLALVHRTTPFIPPGTYVRLPIDPDLLAGLPAPTPTDNLWTDRLGFSL